MPKPSNDAGSAGAATATGSPVPRKIPSGERSTPSGGKPGASSRKERVFIRTSLPPSERRYEVRRSSIHNRGVFATMAIAAGDRIIEYVGEKITKAEAERRSERVWQRAQETGGGAVYLFNLNKKFDIDGAFPWNVARLINHSCDPNCEVEIIKGRIWICALRDIEPGEELTFNYGFDLEDYDSHPCFCGTDACVGFIAGEEFWPELVEKLEKGRAEAARQAAKRKKKKRKK